VATNYQIPPRRLIADFSEHLSGFDATARKELLGSLIEALTPYGNYVYRRSPADWFARFGVDGFPWPDLLALAIVRRVQTVCTLVQEHSPERLFALIGLKASHDGDTLAAYRAWEYLQRANRVPRLKAIIAEHAHDASNIRSRKARTTAEPLYAALRKYPNATTKEILRKLEKAGEIVDRGSDYELIDTGYRLSKTSAASWFSRARKRLRSL